MDEVNTATDAVIEEDEISEPDEDSLAGQMQAMKGGPVSSKKKKVESDSDEDESNTDGDDGGETESETDTDTDEEWGDESARVCREGYCRVW